jgi:hypothetical protein
MVEHVKPDNFQLLFNVLAAIVAPLTLTPPFIEVLVTNVAVSAIVYSVALIRAKVRIVRHLCFPFVHSCLNGRQVLCQILRNSFAYQGDLFLTNQNP